MPQSRVINIAVRESGVIIAKRAFGVDSEIAEANLELHSKPWQLDDLLADVKREILASYDEMNGR